MKHLFKQESLKKLIDILLLLLIVKLLWFAVGILWLPSSGVNNAKEIGAKPLYYRAKLTPNKAAVPTKKTPVATVKREESMAGVLLLAVYSASDATVVTVEHNKKTKVLVKGDSINGFILESAGNNFAKFSKNSKTYKISLLKGKGNKDSIVKDISDTNSSSPKIKSSEALSKPEGEIVDAGGVTIIDKSLLDHYAKNMDDIYKDIGIAESKKGKDIDGFKITFVRKDSHFAKLGVKRGDILKSINGQEINSYNVAFDIYKNIQSVQNLTLVIERDKEEVELEYEIN